MALTSCLTLAKLLNLPVTTSGVNNSSSLCGLLHRCTELIHGKHLEPCLAPHMSGARERRVSYYYPLPWDSVLSPPATEAAPPLSSQETEEEAVWDNPSTHPCSSTFQPCPHQLAKGGSERCLFQEIPLATEEKVPRDKAARVSAVKQLTQLHI